MLKSYLILSFIILTCATSNIIRIPIFKDLIKNKHFENKVTLKPLTLNVTINDYLNKFKNFIININEDYYEHVFFNDEEKYVWYTVVSLIF